MREKNEKYFLNWEKAGSSPVPDVGGKGKNLGLLYRYGFSVPAGGVLISQVYWDFLEHNELTEMIQYAAAIKADEVLTCEKQLEKIRQKINEGEVPDHVRKELNEVLSDMLLLEKALAVRSSAASEDSASASFAGIHDSFLNVKGVENIIIAIKGCYASLWTTRAVAYRRKMGLMDNDVAVSIVIMEQVRSAASGIAFSCDPRTGRRDRIMISANFGLGESVVSGAVEPDEYTLYPGKILPEIIEKNIGSKSKFTTLKPTNGTELVSTDDSARKK